MSSTRRHRNRMGLWGHLSGSLCAIIVMILVTGCGSTGTSRIAAPLPSGLMNDAEKQRVQSVMAEISERNRTVEDDPNWIKLAYDTPMIRKLEDIDESKYTDFRQYLAGDAVYIIVHPGYNTFFHSSEVYSAGAADAPADSAMDRYLRHRYYSARYQLIQSQEKRVRDFLEFASTERRLVILLLPGNYRQYREYNYLKDNDEYLRYINEATNASDTVLYLYSRQPNKGIPEDEAGRKLLKFLFAVKPGAILVGGGYVGRCLEDFYMFIERFYGSSRIYVVPELTVFSPNDITDYAAQNILHEDGTLDSVELAQAISFKATGNRDLQPQMMNLSLGDRGMIQD